MKRYIAILSTLFIIPLFFGLYSCTKKQPADTLFGRIQGTWTKTAYATDDNNNGVIDPQEIHPQSSSTVDELVLKGDNTGYEKNIINNVEGYPLNFNWSIYGDSLTLTYIAHDTVTYYIETINSFNLTLYANTNAGLVAYYYKSNYKK